MYSPDVAMGLGTIVYALCKLAGQLHREETKVARDLLTKYPYSDLAICAMFLRDNVNEPAEEAYAFGLWRMVVRQVERTKEGSLVFCCVLHRLMTAFPFIRQFWRELQQPSDEA